MTGELRDLEKNNLPLRRMILQVGRSKRSVSDLGTSCLFINQGIPTDDKNYK